MVRKSRFVIIRKLWPWLMFSLAALFYWYEYLLRVSPSVMMQYLSVSYHINATMLGSVIACYYYLYIPMQLCVGILFDKYGSRVLLALACFSCGIGSYLFVCGSNVIIAQLGRSLVGFGSAFAFVGVLQLARLWLPRERFAFISGITLALGMLGGLCSDVLLAGMIERFGWQYSSYLLAGIGFVLSILLFLIIRDRKRNIHVDCRVKMDSARSFSDILQGAGEIFRNNNIWLSSIVGCFLYETFDQYVL